MTKYIHKNRANHDVEIIVFRYTTKQTYLLLFYLSNHLCLKSEILFIVVSTSHDSIILAEAPMGEHATQWQLNDNHHISIDVCRVVLYIYVGTLRRICQTNLNQFVDLQWSLSLSSSFVVRKWSWEACDTLNKSSHRLMTY